MSNKASIAREARRATLALARSYPPRAVEPYSLRTYYWSVAQGLRELEYGKDDPLDGEPFTCYQGLDFDPDLQQRFKDAWGYEIGQMAGIISSISTDLKQALGGDK